MYSFHHLVDRNIGRAVDLVLGFIAQNTHLWRIGMTLNYFSLKTENMKF